MPPTPSQPESKSIPISSEKRPKENYDHLIPPANRILRFTLKAGWHLAKGLVKIAIRLPRLFVRANQPHNEPHSQPRPKE